LQIQALESKKKYIYEKLNQEVFFLMKGRRENILIIYIDRSSGSIFCGT